MANTMKTNLIIPEVMGQMISANLPKALKFLPIANVDNTLQGQPGDTVKIPVWAFIGEAATLAEGARLEATQMTATTKSMPISKCAKGVVITDEAKNSALGDPIGEATKQLTMAIASKIDTDVITELAKTNVKLDKSTEIITYNGIVEAVDKFDEETDTQKFLFIAPSQLTQLRLDPNFIDRNKYGGEVMMTGEVGMVAGCRVVPSRKIEAKTNKIKNYIVCSTPEAEDGTPALPALTIFKKTEVVVESQRDLDIFADKIVASQHYGVGLTNESKVVEVTFKAK